MSRIPSKERSISRKKRRQKVESIGTITIQLDFDYLLDLIDTVYVTYTRRNLIYISKYATYAYNLYFIKKIQVGS